MKYGYAVMFKLKSGRYEIVGFGAQYEIYARKRTALTVSRGIEGTVVKKIGVFYEEE